MSWFEMIWDHHDQREDGGHHVCGCEEKRLCWEGMGRHQVQGNFYIIGKRVGITIRDYHFHKKSNLFLEISKRYKSSYKKQTRFSALFWNCFKNRISFTENNIVRMWAQLRLIGENTYLG